MEGVRLKSSLISILPDLDLHGIGDRSTIFSSDSSGLAPLNLLKFLESLLELDLPTLESFMEDSETPFFKLRTGKIRGFSIVAASD